MNPIKTIFWAVVTFFQMFGPLLLKVLGIAVDSFTLRARYLKEQMEKEKLLQQRLLDQQKLREEANLKAFDAIIEAAWKIRYDDILGMIKSNDHAAVLKVTRLVDNEKVDQILFMTDSSPEYKAMKIVNIMKGIK
jgi:hypothetical protein